MDPQYGLGIRKYLFEPTGGKLQVGIDDGGYKKFILENYEQDIFDELTRQANKYNPEIFIETIKTQIEDSVMFLKVYYNYKGFVTDFIEVAINL